MTGLTRKKQATTSLRQNLIDKDKGEGQSYRDSRSKGCNQMTIKGSVACQLGAESTHVDWLDHLCGVVWNFKVVTLWDWKYGHMKPCRSLCKDGGLFSRPKLTLYSPTISSWSPDSFIVGSPDSCCNLSTTRYECCFVLYSLFPRRFFCHHSAQCCVPLALLDGSWQMPSMVSELAWLISHAKGHLLNLILRYL